MKNLLNVMMKTKVLIAFIVTMLIAKLLLHRYRLPEEYPPLISIFKTVFLIVFAISAIHVITFFILVFINGRKEEKWWDEVEEKKDETASARFLNLVFKILEYNFPVFVYCMICSVAIFSSWRFISMMIVGTVVSAVFKYRENKKQLSKTSTIDF